jgi:integrase
VLALKKPDLIPVGLCIDERSFNGRAVKTKNKKTRYAPISDSQRSEIEEWAVSIDGDLLFPTPLRTMYRRYSTWIREMLEATRIAAGIPDLTFRACRTTLTTLCEGDLKEAQTILGHSTVELTMRIYKKPIAERRQASVEELDARLSGKVVSIKKRETA